VCRSLIEPFLSLCVLSNSASLLWVGWAGFNGGSAFSASYGVGQALLMINISTGASMLGWILWDYIEGRKVSAIGASAGAVVGLVGISPGCGFVTAGDFSKQKDAIRRIITRDLRKNKFKDLVHCDLHDRAIAGKLWFRRSLPPLLAH